MGRTPKALMIWRVARVPWMCIFLLGMAGGVIPGFGILFLVVGVVAGMMLFFSLVCRIFGWLFLGDDPGYQQFRANGGDPYFDLTLPEGINNDSWAVRCGGQPEPDTAFEPPHDWLYQCNACGARNEFPHGACWHCGSNLAPPPTSRFSPSVNQGVPRILDCWQCHREVQEMNPGDLENGGVMCPFCGAHMIPS